jgi:glucosamine-6-phosphate deaminase
MLKEFRQDKLLVRVFSDREQLGKAAAENVIKQIKELQETRDEIRIVFASAPSQNELLDGLVSSEGIDWSKIVAFHMDEYIGLKKGSRQLFGTYLCEKIFDKKKLKEVHLVSPFEDPEAECRRYQELLRQKPVDIICLGIGENGHIAFNDPPVADFNESQWVKIVEIDNVSRQQQVNDGTFASFDEVPKTAVTLTIPAMISGRYLTVAVSGIRKAEAVRKTLFGKISTECPATILREHGNAVLFLDINSAADILG